MISSTVPFILKFRNKLGDLKVGSLQEEQIAIELANEGASVKDRTLVNNSGEIRLKGLFFSIFLIHNTSNSAPSISGAEMRSKAFGSSLLVVSEESVF